LEAAAESNAGRFGLLGECSRHCPTSGIPAVVSLRGIRTSLCVRTVAGMRDWIRDLLSTNGAMTQEAREGRVGGIRPVRRLLVT
jgi:hypothetical protein